MTLPFTNQTRTLGQSTKELLKVSPGSRYKLGPYLANEHIWPPQYLWFYFLNFSPMRPPALNASPHYLRLPASPYSSRKPQAFPLLSSSNSCSSSSYSLPQVCLILILYSFSCKQTLVTDLFLHLFIHPILTYKNHFPFFNGLFS